MACGHQTAEDREIPKSPQKFGSKCIDFEGANITQKPKSVKRMGGEKTGPFELDPWEPKWYDFGASKHKNPLWRLGTAVLTSPPRQNLPGQAA